MRPYWYTGQHADIVYDQDMCFRGTICGILRVAQRPGETLHHLLDPVFTDIMGRYYEFPPLKIR